MTPSPPGPVPPSPSAGPLRAGFDLGGTRLKAGLVRGGTRVAARTVFLAPADRTEEGVLALLESTLDGLLAGAGAARGDVASAGVGAAGAVRFADGVVVQSPHQPAWRDFALRDRLAARLGLPVAVDNDANAVTLGEALHGAGRGHPDFACVTLGSGIGGGLFLGGRLWRGAGGMAGEIGHATVVAEGRPCACGNRGCLEQYASAEALRHAAREGAFPGADPGDPDLPRRMFEAARDGHPGCRAAFEDLGYWLAVGLGTLLQVVDVPLVVLSGGLAGAFPAFGDRLRAELPRRGYPCITGPARVVPGSLSEDAGVLGAAALPEPRLSDP